MARKARHAKPSPVQPARAAKTLVAAGAGVGLAATGTVATAAPAQAPAASHPVPLPSHPLKKPAAKHAKAVVRDSRSAWLHGLDSKPLAPSADTSGPFTLPGNWAKVANCESSMNPHASTGTYFGLFQFDMGTWRSVGGSGNPANASPREQFKRALILYSHSGSSPWPVCGRYL